jgi:hypothetical protein
MKWLTLRVLLVGFAMLFAVLPARALDLGTLDGTWEGNLAVTPVPTSAGPGGPYTVRIVITGANARVFTHGLAGGAFHEIKPGLFKVARIGPSGVIVALDQGDDDEGTWVETWTFSVTLKQPDTLITNFYRVVNNVDLPLTVDHSKFSEAKAGELLRTK